MEDDMAVDTAVDAELWLILVAMIGWITLGCFMTSRHRRLSATAAIRDLTLRARRGVSHFG
jgi:hypothetical protein